MLFVFGICPVADSFVRIEIPVLANLAFSWLQLHERGWRNRVDPHVRRQMSCGKESEPARDVFLAQLEFVAGEQYQWIEDRAPGDPGFFDGVVQVPCADWVFR